MSLLVDPLARPSPAPASSSASPPRLKASLDLKDLVAYGLAYIAPIAPLTTLGFVWQASGGLIALAYLIGTACMLFTANSYVQFSRELRSAGSVYAYVQHALGPAAGLVAGWLILLDYLLIPALVQVMMAVGMEAVLPGVPRTVWLVAVAGLTLGINWFGITLTARVNLASVLLQLLFLALLLGLCVWALTQGTGQGGLSLRPFYDAQAFRAEAVLAGAGLCVLAFLGFDAVSTLGEETQGSDRGLVGRATLWVMGLSGAVFVLVAWVLGNVMPAVTVTEPATAVFALGEQIFGPWALVVLALVMIVLVGFTNALPMQAGVARVLFAMARDGRLPAPLARVHARHGTPHVAMLLASALSFAASLALLDHAELLTTLVNFGALAAFALLHVAVMVHFAGRGGSRRAAHTILPALGLAVALTVLAALPRTALLLGGAWLLAGLALAWVQRQRGPGAGSRSIGA